MPFTESARKETPHKRHVRNLASLDSFWSSERLLAAGHKKHHPDPPGSGSSRPRPDDVDPRPRRN